MKLKASIRVAIIGVSISLIGGLVVMYFQLMSAGRVPKNVSAFLGPLSDLSRIAFYVGLLVFLFVLHRKQ